MDADDPPDSESAVQQQPFVVVASTGEFLYPWVDGLLPRPEISPFVKQEWIPTDKIFVNHELTLFASGIHIETMPLIKGKWPKGESELVLNNAFPMQAPWSVACNDSAFLSLGGAPAIQGFATPKFRVSAEVPLSNAHLTGKIVAWCRSHHLNDKDEADSCATLISKPDLAKEIVMTFASHLQSRHPSGIHYLTYESCTDPWFSLRPFGVEWTEQQCPHCGGCKKNVVCTGEDMSLVCPGRMIIKIHERNNPSDGGIDLNHQRYSIYYAACGEVLEERIPASKSVTYETMNSAGNKVQIESTDSKTYTYAEGISWASYSSKLHLDRKMSGNFPTAEGTRMLETFLRQRLIDAGKLYFTEGESTSAMLYMLDLVTWSGKTCRAPQWRLLSARIGPRMQDVCKTASVALCGSARNETVGPMVQSALISTLRAKLHEQSTAAPARVEIIGDSTMRYTGKPVESRIIFQVLGQFISSSLGISLLCIGRTPLYTDEDSRARISRSALLGRLNAAAKDLGWPECEFYEHRAATGVLFRRKDKHVVPPPLDSIPCVKAVSIGSTPSTTEGVQSIRAPKRPAPETLVQCTATKRQSPAPVPSSSAVPCESVADSSWIE